MARNSIYPESVKAGKPILSSLPQGWQLISLDKCLSVENRKADLQNDQEYDLVTVKRSRGGVVRREHLNGKSISVKSQFYIHEGDFLISKRQIVHGACGIVPENLNGSIVSNEYCVMTGKAGFHLPYMEYLSETLYFQQTCFHSSIGVHIEKMIFKLESWFKWPFNIPPLPEQKKIVKILATWDQAISTTEQLLANSQQQKKALMQQLLTGKKRLLGINSGLLFDCQFKSLPLKKICSMQAGKFISASDICNEQRDGTYPCFGGNGLRGYAETFTHDGNYSIIGRQGALCGNITFATGRFHATEHAVVVTPQSYIDTRWLYYALIDLNLNQYATGLAQPGLSVKNIEQVTINVPEDTNEQIKIASVLTAADQEIETLQRKLDCLKQEKKALMQQLLTGKRRVTI